MKSSIAGLSHKNFDNLNDSLKSINSFTKRRIMNQKDFVIWFSLLGIIGTLFGIVYAFFGLAILPVSRDVLLPWGNGVYGATLIGFSVTIFFAGRHAFRKNDSNLIKALLFGIFSWLIVEALFSLYYGVYFNFGVDVTLMIFFGFPLIKMITLLKTRKLKTN